MNEEVFDDLSTALLGTGQDLQAAIDACGLDVAAVDAERILNRGGIGRCAGCGTWAYITDEYCEECEEDAWR